MRKGPISNTGGQKRKGGFYPILASRKNSHSLLDRGEKKGYFYLVSCKEFWFGMKQAAWLFKLMRFSY
jgi:hypothetical protein